MNAGQSAGQNAGRVVAVNVAVVRTAEWAMEKEGGRTGIDKRPAAGPVLLAADGVAGDTVCDTHHHGGPDQAVYAYSTADLVYWTAELGQEVEPGGVGENLTLDGIDCSGAVIGERWQVGAAVLRVRGPRTPCRVFAGFRGVPDLIKRFLAAGRPGSYLSVETPGHVQAGDPVTVLDRPAHGITVADVMAATTVARDRLPGIAVAREHLGVRDRERLDRALARG